MAEWLYSPNCFSSRVNKQLRFFQQGLNILTWRNYLNRQMRHIIKTGNIAKKVWRWGKLIRINRNIRRNAFFNIEGQFRQRSEFFQSEYLNNNFKANVTMIIGWHFISNFFG